MFLYQLMSVLIQALLKLLGRLLWRELVDDVELGHVMAQRGVAQSRRSRSLHINCKGWVEAKHSEIQVSLFDHEKTLPCFMYFPFFFNSSYFLASVIQLSLIVRSNFSFPFVSSGFKNSLKSSSHLLLGLPTGLRVLIVS